MARIVGIFSLITVLLVQSLSTSLIFTTFEINQSTFTELFCVNKDKPEMHCDGKCFLEKQIKADKESHQNNSKTIPDFVTLVFTLSENIDSLFLPYFKIVKPGFNYVIHTYSQFPISIFHPPRF